MIRIGKNTPGLDSRRQPRGYKVRKNDPRYKYLPRSSCQETLSSGQVKKHTAPQLIAMALGVTALVLAGCDKIHNVWHTSHRVGSPATEWTIEQAKKDWRLRTDALAVLRQHFAAEVSSLSIDVLEQQIMVTGHLPLAKSGVDSLLTKTLQKHLLPVYPRLKVHNKVEYGAFLSRSQRFLDRKAQHILSLRLLGDMRINRKNFCYRVQGGRLYLLGVFALPAHKQAVLDQCMRVGGIGSVQIIEVPCPHKPLSP